MKCELVKKPLGRPRLLIVGCGDVGMRLLALVRGHYRVFAVTSQPERRAELRAAGAVPIVANLDDPASLRRLAGLASTVVHLAPPRSDGACDWRSRHLRTALRAGTRVVYVSTTGVYGDCGGALFDETRPLAPQNARALRRVDAEQVLRGRGASWGTPKGRSRWRGGVRASVLRVPGIYAEDRLPLKRLREGTPALAAQEDVYTNHIHADDLARALALALQRGAPGRVYHAVDDSDMKMADYFDAVAEAYRLPKPPRLIRTELAQQVSPVLLSFMSESRRLKNVRLKTELGLRFRYPDVRTALAAWRPAQA